MDFYYLLKIKDIPFKKFQFQTSIFPISNFWSKIITIPNTFGLTFKHNKTCLESNLKTSEQHIFQNAEKNGEKRTIT